MKTKIFLSSALVLAVLLAATAIGVGEVSAATGNLKNIFPPGNNGSTRGVGMIDGHDGNKYVFRTPGDNGGKELIIDATISFNVVNRRLIDSVTQETRNPIGEAGSGLIDQIKDGDARAREGGHTIGAGQVAEIVKGIDGNHGENGDTMPPKERIKKQEGTITIMKRLPDHSLEMIELRMKTGTVKFFNEKKTADSNLEDSLTDTTTGDKVIHIIKGIRN